MIEEKRECKTYRVHAKCSKCSTGYMLPDGKILLSDPPKYPHTCNNCGHKEDLDNKYPAFAWENV